MKVWETWFKIQGTPFLFINCMEKSAVKIVLALAKKIIEEKRQANNPDQVKAARV